MITKQSMFSRCTEASCLDKDASEVISDYFWRRAVLAELVNNLLCINVNNLLCINVNNLLCINVIGLMFSW